MSENNLLDWMKVGYVELGVIYYLLIKLFKLKVFIEIVDFVKKKKVFVVVKDKVFVVKIVKVVVIVEVVCFKVVVVELVK